MVPTEQPGNSSFTSEEKFPVAEVGGRQETRKELIVSSGRMAGAPVKDDVSARTKEFDNTSTFESNNRPTTEQLRDTDYTEKRVTDEGAAIVERTMGSSVAPHKGGSEAKSKTGSPELDSTYINGQAREGTYKTQERSPERSSYGNGRSHESAGLRQYETAKREHDDGVRESTSYNEATSEHTMSQREYQSSAMEVRSPERYSYVQVAKSREDVSKWTTVSPERYSYGNRRAHENAGIRQYETAKREHNHGVREATFYHNAAREHTISPREYQSSRMEIRSPERYSYITLATPTEGVSTSSIFGSDAWVERKQVPAIPNLGTLYPASTPQRSAQSTDTEHDKSVERIVEVEKIVEKIVEVPVEREVVREIEKLVEVPVVKEVIREVEVNRNCDIVFCCRCPTYGKYQRIADEMQLGSRLSATGYSRS